MSHDFLVQWPIIFLRRYKKFAALFFLLAGNKEFQRGQMCSHTHMLQMQMRRNEHGTYSTHTARGFSIPRTLHTKALADIEKSPN